MPPPEAIRKMTSLPATHFQIENRGMIQAGRAADIVVFDPDTVHDHATYGTPHALSTGISHVIVNGLQTLNSGIETGLLPGRIV